MATSQDYPQPQFEPARYKFVYEQGHAREARDFLLDIALSESKSRPDLVFYILDDEYGVLGSGNLPREMAKLL